MATSSDRIAFTGALIRRFLAQQRLEPEAAKIVEMGMAMGRHMPRKPPLPLQQPERYYPGLTARPWHDPAAFAWIAALESAYPAIRAEALRLQTLGRFGRNVLSGDLADGSWEDVRLVSEGLRHVDDSAACPHTMSVIERISGALSAGLVYFAKLDPGGHVRPHFGPHNARLRCHLGLVVPKGCSLRVGEETRSWAEGRALIFDDSFEHEVWNQGNGTRLILSFDIWHPDLSQAQILAIRYAESPFLESAYEIAQGWVETGTIEREP